MKPSPEVKRDQVFVLADPRSLAIWVALFAETMRACGLEVLIGRLDSSLLMSPNEKDSDAEGDFLRTSKAIVIVHGPTINPSTLPTDYFYYGVAALTGAYFVQIYRRPMEAGSTVPLPIPMGHYLELSKPGHRLRRYMFREPNREDRDAHRLLAVIRIIEEAATIADSARSDIEDKGSENMGA